MRRVAIWLGVLFVGIAGLLVLAGVAQGAEMRVTTAKTIAQMFQALPDQKRAEVLAELSDVEVAELLRATEGLCDFIPRVTPKYSAPRHLLPLIERLEASRDQEIRAVIHAPPRHVKTDTILTAIAWLLGQDPTRTHAFVTYEKNLAQSKSRKARNMAVASGVQLASDAKSLSEWLTPDGGGMLATGVGGPLTGRGVTGLLVVDDPVKNRVEAESETTREKVWDWFNDVAFTRLEPGASCIVVMTRWHPGDLAGKLIDEKGWPYIKLPAIDGEGKALWPDQYPVERLEAIHEQLGDYGWTSLYQGEPRSKGGQVFHDAHIYDRAPERGYRASMGLDLAYSKKTHADYSVHLTLAECDGLFYVLNVERKQVQAPHFARFVAAEQKLRGYPRTRWYVSGTELGGAQLLGGFEVKHLNAVPTHADKFIRAQPVAAAWNAGKVLVPRNAPWVDKFVSEVVGFTGVDDEHDDQVDALSAAYDELNHAVAGFGGMEPPHTKRRM